MKFKISTYTALLAVILTLASCSQDAQVGSGFAADSERIFFRSYLPGISPTRAGVTSTENLSECHVTCLNPNDTTLIDSQSGKMKPYFSDMRFEKDDDGRFLALESDTSVWPAAKSRLHFFAYHPSAETMQNKIDTEKFNLVNRSITSNEETVIDYRMESFRVPRNIEDHVDFISAYSDGTQQANGSTGIELNFRHNLARIELMAWSQNKRYGIEIAGVRIGNAISEGDFNFSSLTTGQPGEWINTEGHQSVVEHIFGEGESIVYLSKNPENHTDKEHAASIMGTAGPAMVIPMTERIEAWGGLEDPGLETEQYTTDKLYFSVLLRVKNWADEMVYPYRDDKYNIPKVYLAVGNDGKIIRRVYKKGNEYYTADDENDELKYYPTETEEILDFCWAALPVAAKWEAGKIYTYKLNYTNGIGWHDPSYPIPGNPIIDERVGVNVEVTDWKDGTNPSMNDITVPRK
ncbi:MAG: fimbrillin family protein [Muribaculaceae bacterium]|nr:fimbrillin family protein [Muribaculaceae bacterium]